MYLWPPLVNLKPSTAANLLPSLLGAWYGAGHSPRGSSPGFGSGNWCFRPCRGARRTAQSTRLRVFSRILLVAVQNLGSSFSLDRFRWCWGGTSFCVVQVLVASAVVAGWTKHSTWSCVCGTLPGVLNHCDAMCGCK